MCSIVSLTPVCNIRPHEEPRGLAHILLARRTESCEVLPYELQADLQLVPTFIEVQLLQHMPKCTKHPEDDALMITAIASLGCQASKRASNEVEDNGRSGLGRLGVWGRASLDVGV